MPPPRSIGIIPSAGNRYFVFHEFMYSALPTKLMLRGTLNIKNALSRKLMWFGARIAGPSAGNRSKPSRLIVHSTSTTGRPTRRNRVCALPAPRASTWRIIGT